jgi:hypothetical protein
MQTSLPKNKKAELNVKLMKHQDYIKKENYKNSKNLLRKRATNY